MIWTIILITLGAAVACGVLGKLGGLKLGGSLGFAAGGAVITFPMAFIAILFGMPAAEIVLVFTGATTAVVALPAIGRTPWHRLMVTTICAGGVALLFNWWLMAIEMPQFNGTLGGYNFLIFWNALIAIVATAIATFTAGEGSQRGRHADRESSVDLGMGTSMLLSAAIAIFCVGFYCVQDARWHWGAGPKRYYASFVNMEIAKDTETLPPTDMNNARQVPPDVACTRARNALSNNAEFATLFMVDCSEMTSLTIAGHLWAVAPLEYQDYYSQEGWFGTTFYANSPGYVQVDLQDANGAGQLKVGPDYELNFFPSAMLDKNLYRHLYKLGYTNGNIDDLSIEPDDNGKPYFVASYNIYEVGVDGERIQKVLVIDAKTGKVAEYKLGETPAWVDRVVSQQLRERYVGDYLKFGWKPEALQNWSLIWGGSGNQFTYQSYQLVLDASRDHPLALMPVTSNDNTNEAVVATVACETNNNKCKLYPGLAGIQSARHAVDACSTAMKGSRTVAGRVDQPQLYYAFSRPTWFAAIASDNGSGISGFCLVDASAGKTNSSNAALGNDLRTTLAVYARKLDSEGSGNQVGVDGGILPAVTVHGTIDAIGPISVNGEIAYEIIVKNDEGKLVPLVFLANPAQVPAALLEKGNEVTIYYSSGSRSVQPQIDRIDAPRFKSIPAEALRLGGETVAPAAAKPAQPK